MSTENVRAERHQLLRRVKTASSLFYLVAVLTLLNSIMIHCNIMQGSVLLPVGLYGAQFLDKFGPVDLAIPLWIVIVCDVAFAAIYAYLGYQARQRKLWALMAGTYYFLFDAIVLSIGLSDVFMLLFDIYAAVMMMSGLRAARKLRGMDKTLLDEGADLEQMEQQAIAEEIAERQAAREKKKHPEKEQRQQPSNETTVISIDPSAAWPEPMDKKARQKAIEQRRGLSDAQEAPGAPEDAPTDKQ
nr:hypothetical protein [Maliibacterium massiliense]